MELRVARHSNDLKAMEHFYTKILGFEVFFSFEGHNGYNGIFLGKPELDWHLEFTSSEHPAHHTFDEDDILVLYPTNSQDFDKIINAIETNDIEQLEAKNPYWDENGIMIKDPDGYNIIISHLKTE